MFKPHIHYSHDLEKAILGAIMLEPTAFGRMYGILQPEVFYLDFHQTIYTHMQKMWEDNKPIDMVTVTITLCKTENKATGSTLPFEISEITKRVCSTANLEYHSMILRQMYIEREMINITHSGTNGKEGIAYMDELQDKLLKLRQIKATNDFKTVDEVLIELYKHMDTVKDKPLAGITTGFKSIDRITGGFENGGMYILAARPSVGKSAFMGQMVLGAAKAGSKVGVISLEMENKKVMARMAAIISDIDFWKIYRGKMYNDYEQQQFQSKMLHEMTGLPIKISDNANVNIGDIKSKAARLKQKGELDILFIDYLGLIDTDDTKKSHSREQEVSKISRGLKLMAMQYQIPVVLLCQLNRMSEEKKERPKLHNLRESGSLEQDADGVMFIHREFKSGKLTNADGTSTENEADILIEKWRNGETADLKFGWDGPKMKFIELGEENPKQDYHQQSNPPGNYRPLTKEEQAF